MYINISSLICIHPPPPPAVVVLGITGAVVWLGGSIVGAGNGASACESQTGGDDSSQSFASLNVFLAVSLLQTLLQSLDCMYVVLIEVSLISSEP